MRLESRVWMRGPIITVVVLLAISCTEQQKEAPTFVDVAVPTRPSAVSVRVSGRVLGFLTGAGVPAAAVRFGAATAVTDGGGSYTIALPGIGAYEPMVDGVIVAASHVTGAGYRGDFLVRPGTCISRYGSITSARTGRPIADAKVSLSGTDARSGSDGWYRVDLGCPSSGPTSFGTTIMSVSHPDYFDRAQVVGRGVFGVFRIDLQLHPR